MSQFSYDEYLKQQAAKRQRAANRGNGQSGDFPKTHFLGEWLREDGDTVVVRFPYHSTDDFIFTSTHSVTFPGNKFPSRVMCSDSKCPLCEQGVKVDTRFLVKAIVYEIDPDTNEVKLVPAVWDRPAAFADVDLKDAIDEYGDLSEQLFKLKRNGTGQNTRYTMTVIVNKTVYNPAVYKADFSVLENIDPAKILVRSMDKYLAALKADQGEETEEAPATSTSAEPESAPAAEKTQPAAKPAINTAARARKDYSF